MGYSRKRVGHSGKPRYTAYYPDLRGEERSAGTFGNAKEADKAWQRAETRIAEGRAGGPARGKQTFRRYVEEEWLPHHVMEATTREGYTYSIYVHIMDTFGPIRMREILPSHVREWVTQLVTDGMSPANIRLNKSILSAIFTTALNDQVTVLHPCRGVKTPTIPQRSLRIVTPEEFDTFYNHLPDITSKLLVETAIESGMRWGELAELRPKDIALRSRIISVSRKVVEVNPRFHPDGGRFMVQEYPKDKETRRFKLSPQIIAKLEAFMEARHLGDSDLFFVYSPKVTSNAREASLGKSSELGLPNPTTTAGSTGMEPSAPTTRANADAATANAPTRTTGQSDAVREKTNPASHAAGTRPDISPAAGSVRPSSNPPSSPPDSTSTSRCTVYAMPTRRGCWPGVPTSK
ncbi:tyrosine-type recombinase/integrase [Micromonospora sp. NPDC050417]|uniref:tyrosine-type recombinase/integrase n=1 Tax=Micromonospora sp. NPDC050417 TaxID=3364280 RepID=UPI003795E136